MRKLLAGLAVAAVISSFTIQPVAAAGVSVGSHDDRVTGHTYVRFDGGTDATIQACNATDPETFGNLTQNNEPFSVVSPTNPDLVLTGWNDYCSDWMGLGFSTDGGQTWTNSLMPGYPADTSPEGMASPEFVRTNNASDPVAAFNSDGTRFYYGTINYNGFAGPKTNSDVSVARYAVRQPGDKGYATYPLRFLGVTRVGRGPSAANFRGVFNDKNMIEVDRTGGATDGNIYYCWTKFPGSGTPTIKVAHSTDGGATFSKGIGISGVLSGQGCDIAVEADGDVYVSWRTFEFSSSKKNFGVGFARSTDGGQTFGHPHRIASFPGYLPGDGGARDCGDGPDLCPSNYVFGRVPLEPRLTSDPTGELPGVFAIYITVDPATVKPAKTTYRSAGPGLVGQSFVYIQRSVNDGRTWGAPVKVSESETGHQFFPDGDALAGRLAVMWQDSREDACYSLQRPISNTADATACSHPDGTNSYVAVSTDGQTFGSTIKASSQGQMLQYEMFDARDVPFFGDYNWIQLVELPDGSLFGYLSWTDNRDVVPGTDPREETQDGFDVHMCLDKDLVNTCPNAGGFDQNIYGNTVSIP